MISVINMDKSIDLSIFILYIVIPSKNNDIFSISMLLYGMLICYLNHYSSVLDPINIFLLIIIYL